MFSLTNKIILFLSLIIFSIPSVSFADVGLAIVTFCNGTPQVKHLLNTGWDNLGMNGAVARKDRIRTAPNTQAEIVLGDGTAIFVDEKTELQVKDITENGERRINGAIFKLLSGRLYLNISESNSKQLDVETTNFVVRVPQTDITIKNAECAIEVSETGATKIIVFSGQVQVDPQHLNLIAKPEELHQTQNKKLHNDAIKYRKIIVGSHLRIKQVKEETGYSGIE